MTEKLEAQNSSINKLSQQELQSGVDSLKKSINSVNKEHVGITESEESDWDIIIDSCYKQDNIMPDTSGRTDVAIIGRDGADPAEKDPFGKGGGKSIVA